MSKPKHEVGPCWCGASHAEMKIGDTVEIIPLNEGDYRFTIGFDRYAQFTTARRFGGVLGRVLRQDKSGVLLKLTWGGLNLSYNWWVANHRVIMHKKGK